MSRESFDIRPIPQAFNPPQDYQPPPYDQITDNTEYPNLNSEDYRFCRKQDRSTKILPYYEHIDQTSDKDCILLGTNSYYGRHLVGNVFGFESFSDLKEEKSCFQLQSSGTITGLKHVDSNLFLLTSSNSIEFWSKKSSMRSQGFCLFRISHLHGICGTPTDLKLLKGANKAITSSTLASVQLWDYGTSDLLPLTVIDEAHFGAITGISLNPNSNKSFISCSEDRSILMWDIKSPIAKSRAIYEHHSEPFRSIHFGDEQETGGKILAGDDAGFLYSFDSRKSGEILSKLKVECGPIRKILFNGKYFAVLNGTQYLRVYEFQKTDAKPKMIFKYSSGAAIIYNCLWDHTDKNYIYLVGEEKYFEKVKVTGI